MMLRPLRNYDAVTVKPVRGRPMVGSRCRLDVSKTATKQGTGAAE